MPTLNSVPVVAAPGTRLFPRPQIPLSPILSVQSFTSYAPCVYPSVVDGKKVLNLTSGRIALALALKHAGVGTGDRVLVPAYHCESMVAPVRWTGADPVFYRIEEDTSVDLEDLTRKIDPNTKAIIVTHYFGFPTNALDVRDICDSSRLSLIEDCAHAFFGSLLGRRLGDIGDYAIASTMKFFPVFDGGCLISRDRNISELTLRLPAFAFELKSLINSLERAFVYGRLRPLGSIIERIFRVKDWLWQSLKARNGTTPRHSLAPPSSDGGFALDPAWIDIRMSSVSRIILALTSKQRLVYRRRQHYQKLAHALSDLPGCKPLFPNLPEDVVPHVFPLFVEQADQIFSVLKGQGVPIWRFGEFLDPSVDGVLCPVSVKFSKQLFQFPCHQDLHPAELDWMIDRIQTAFVQCSGCR